MRYHFGEFSLDSESHRLTRGQQPVRLWPKVFDLLLYLVQHPQRLVSKQELLDNLWSDSHVEESAVPWTVSHARRALGQRGGDKAPIETVHGRGYRFAAEVTIEALASDAPAAPPVAKAVPASPPFVGRERVMAQLDAGAAATLQQRGAMYMLVGPPGIGKTRCLDELSERAARQGFSVWSARCPEDAWAPTLWPWLQLLRAVGREHPELAARAQALVDRMSAGEGRDEDDLAEARHATFLWFDEVSRLLFDAAAARPVVLVIDDIQWADALTLELLAFMAPDLRHHRVLVAVAIRNEYASLKATTMRRIARHTQRIELEPLTEADVESYLALSELAARGGAELAPALHRSTAGYPLFLQHSVRLLKAKKDGLGGGTPLALQALISPVARDTLGASLARLTPDVRALLETASVLGERFELTTLQGLAGHEPERLLEALEAPLREQLLVPDGPNALRFCHALLRQVLYDDLASEERATLHRRAAHALEQRGRGHEGEIAFHYHASLALGDSDRVCTAAQTAAKVAARRHAFANAARYCGWALSAQALSPDTPPRAQAELRLFAAQMQAAEGDHGAARATLGEVVGLSRAHGLTDLLVRAARTLRPTHMMGAVDDPLVRSVLEEALAQAPPGADPVRISALSQLAWVPPYGLDIARSKALSEEALQLAREHGDDKLLRAALNARLHALSGPDDIDALLATADELLAYQPARAWTATAALGARYGAHLYRGDMAKANAVHAELDGLARAHGWPYVIWFADRLATQQKLQSGDLAGAAQALEALSARGARFRLPFAAELSSVVSGVLMLEQQGPQVVGELGGLEPLKQGLMMAPPGLRPPLARLLLFHGDTQTARAVLDELAGDDFARLPRDVNYLSAMAGLGLLAVGLHQRETAQRAYEALLPYAGFNTPNVLMFCEGSVAHFLGTLAAYLGLDGRVAGHFEAALADNERMGLRPQLARTCRAYADWLSARDGGDERARAEALRARALALP